MMPLVERPQEAEPTQSTSPVSILPKLEWLHERRSQSPSQPPPDIPSLRWEPPTLWLVSGTSPPTPSHSRAEPAATGPSRQRCGPHGARPGLQTPSHRHRQRTGTGTPVRPASPASRLTAHSQHPEPRRAGAYRHGPTAAAIFVVAPRKARWDLKAAASPGHHAPGQAPESGQRPLSPLQRARGTLRTGRGGTAGHGNGRERRSGGERGPWAGAHSLLGVVVRAGRAPRCPLGGEARPARGLPGSGHGVTAAGRELWGRRVTPSALLCRACYTLSPSATSTRFLNSSRDGDPTTSLGILLQGLTTLS